MTLTSTTGRIFNKNKANELQKGLKDMKSGTVVSLDVEKKSMSRPTALNTVELLKVASSGLGIGPQDTVLLYYNY